MSEMFCYQCEQTAQGAACTGAKGVCGKSSATANLQDRLTGTLVDLALALDGAVPSPEEARLFVDGLFIAGTNVNFDEEAISAQDAATTAAVVKRRAAAAAGTAVASEAAFDLQALWSAQEDVRSLKTLILLGLRGIAAYAHHAAALGHRDAEVDAFFATGLAAIARPDATVEGLLPVAMQTGQVNLRVMELLDGANTGAFGTPQPTTVTQTVEPGPFIVVSGHDLRDLEILLKQTDGTGISIYTHGEMLPAHAYPALKSYGHLKGNFGTAWQNQQREFEGLPAPVLFTTNCLMPPRESYADRVFTTSVVGYPGLVHVGGASVADTQGAVVDKDFSAVIAKARELGGFAEQTTIPGINGGTSVATGFAHGTVLGVADTVIGAVKQGAIRHFFLVGGCDGARPGRNYFTKFVEQSPSDTVILTLACGKFRFNDLNIGEIGGLPRIMDMGQCNDAYSAIKVALALADAFECGVNELPLTLVLSWYEQKAVAILLTLLSLGIKNILLGPSLPAFVSPAILDFLVENFQIAPISTPEEDLARILG
ncbi:MAG: hydroxylamine reductase [Coriobacteriales bacterium]|jgi:hydroxylamine reductase|nr:hydroxylamine reductase [Coriobacteriales bacterium]